MTRKFKGRELLVATHNAGKVREYRALLGDHITFKSADDIDMPDVEETGSTYLENAKLKALQGAQFSGLPTLGDDSGFGLDALDGRPGLYSARFVKQNGGIQKTFDALQKELGDKNRTARFYTTLCLAWPDGHFEYVAQEAIGQFIYPSRGTGGFGYDPVFMLDGMDKTFGEISETEKNPLSARGKAAQAMLMKCFS